jgi:hypothetical protein
MSIFSPEMLDEGSTPRLLNSVRPLILRLKFGEQLPVLYTDDG